MTEFEYLSVEQIIEINADHGGYPLDMGSIESAAWRPQSGGFGVEKFPDVWSKAAAYVHGIASPQYFSDGNKRTGWFAATTFLAANGHRLPEMPVIEAEFFVQAVAQNVFDTDEEPDKTVEKAAEWFESKWQSQRVGPAQDPRLEYIFLAAHYELADEMESTFTVVAAGCGGIAVGADDVTDVYPLMTEFWVVGRLHWSLADRQSDHVMTVEVVPTAGHEGAVLNAAIHHTFNKRQVFVSSGHPQHQPTGLMPMIFYAKMSPVFIEPAICTVTVDLDGLRIAELPFTASFTNEVPDTVNLP